jgi:cardiolipin synthase A/B
MGPTGLLSDQNGVEEEPTIILHMDFWSFLSDDEVNAVILSREFAIEMEKMFAMDLAESDQIQWEEWKKRPLLPRIREWFAHLFSHGL